MLGCVMNLQLLGQAPGLSRRERLVERGGAMGVKLVHHLDDPLRFRVLDIDQVSDGVRPIDARAVVGNLDPAPPGQRLEEHEQVADALALVLEVIALDLTGARWQRPACLTDQLLRGLIHADQRPLRVVGPRVDVQHILQVVDKLGIRRGRNAPLLLPPGLQFVFFKVRRTVSYERLSTYVSSTILSASNCKVQRAAPVGGGLQAKAIKCASWRPSSLRNRGFSGRRGSRAAAKLSSTKRRRTRSMVGMLTSTASAIAASVQAAPFGLWSALRRMRAWASLRAAPFPAPIKSWSVWRSSGVKVTR